jgi:Fe-S-cluster containining protein
MPTSPAKAEEAGMDVGSLCRDCGACCNWVLFRHANLTPPEVVWAKHRKLPILEEPSGTSMRIPCAAHGDDLRCTVYDERPAVCRSYECELVKDVRAGTVRPDDADERVRELREVASRIQQRVANGRGSAEVAIELTRIRKASEKGALDADVDLLRDVGVLRALVRRHFVRRMGDP